ncbi:FtsW/RodA/SpoVE family cell cycle protein [uncultured Clostridium sp.]|uniref:FtsW/RodA/SpoVE family cell cycle protein n=1 Tax=uncultured Clostridium sp. TaxID=59620 RepID=UPI0028E3242C|nr:FtsW/RodA/SpoVE family cell cycle protein [uncultured Clostridium sp.]
MRIGEDKRVKEYLHNLLLEIKNKEVHEEIELEITGHIEDLYETYVDEGLGGEEAIKKAILEMGDAKGIGEKLNKIHKGKVEWSIVIPSILMCLFGIFLMFFMVGYVNNFPQIMAEKTVVSSIMGFIIAVILYIFDYRKIKKYCGKIFIAANLILLIQLLFPPINGAKKFITIGPITISTLQVYLFLICVSLPGVLEDVKAKNNKVLFRLLAIYAIPSLLIFLIPSGIDFIIYTCIFMVLCISNKFPRKYIVLMPAVFIGAIIILFASSPYRINRLISFINKDPNGMGYIYNLIDSLIKSSGILGNGIDQNIQLLLGVGTDFIFLYIIYTFGWILALSFIALAAFFIIRMFATARVVKDNYGRLILMSFGTLFLIQFSWNILMNLNLIPVMGISCPFISYGATSMLLNISSIGLIMSVYRRKDYSPIIIN